MPAFARFAARSTTRRRMTTGPIAALSLLALAACGGMGSATTDGGVRDADRHHDAGMGSSPAPNDADAPVADSGTVTPTDDAGSVASNDMTMMVGTMPDAAPVAVGALALTRFVLDKSQVSVGGTITGTVTLANLGSAPVTLRTVVITGRPPGGTHAGGPYDDLAPTASPSTIAPGDALTLTATRTIASTDPVGTWESYGTWQDDAGAWHDAPSLFFTVDAAMMGGGSDGGMGGSTPPMAPGGYYVKGNTVYDAAGKAHLFHGVDRPTLESVSTGYMLSAADYQLMASWKARIVRVPLNQDFWLTGSAMYDPNFVGIVDQQVQWAHAAGLDVILDLHCSDKGDASTTTASQQLMADQNSVRFWKEVATRYKGDGRVLFELYNEPHDISWEVWQSGGVTSEGWTAVGMQQLYDTVRATGAENLVVIGGNSWSSDLSGVATHRIVGHNIVYAAHPYDWPGDRTPSDWMQLWGTLAQTDPVILTEFGDSPQTMPACSTSYYSNVIAFADAHNVGWTSWAWMVWSNPCLYPTIISDWNGTPNAMGAVVKQALESYP